MKLVGKIIGASIFGVLTIALSIGSGIAKQYEPQLNLVLNASTQKIIPDPDEIIWRPRCHNNLSFYNCFVWH